MKVNCGGIIVQDLVPFMKNFQERVDLTLGEDPYLYKIITLRKGQDFIFEEAMRYCIYILEDNGAAIFINEISSRKDQFLIGYANRLQIQSPGKESTLLIAAQKDGLYRDPLCLIDIRDKNVKRVEKPWGYEIWLTGDPSRVFAFKKIFLKAGNKTSLQFHRQKRETNFIVHGEAKLHYYPDSSMAPEEISTEKIAKALIVGPSIVDVFPNHVHRLEAHKDLLLYEISTPELDDVIRISDDSGRGHGRIETEHIV